MKRNAEASWSERCLYMMSKPTVGEDSLIQIYINGGNGAADDLWQNKRRKRLPASSSVLQENMEDTPW